MTKLHCDLSDAVNMLLYQGAAIGAEPAGAIPRRVRCGNEMPGSDARCVMVLEVHAHVSWPVTFWCQGR